MRTAEGLFQKNRRKREKVSLDSGLLNHGDIFKVHSNHSVSPENVPFTLAPIHRLLLFFFIVRMVHAESDTNYPSFLVETLNFIISATKLNSI